MVRRAAAPVLDELALTLESVAAGDRAARSPSRPSGHCCAHAPLDELEANFEEAVSVSVETARFAPVRRRESGVASTSTPTPPSRSTSRSATSACSHGRARAACALRENLPPGISDAVRELAEAVGALRGAPGGPLAGAGDVRGPALRAAARATVGSQQTGNLSVTVVVGEARSTAVDLLRGSGLTYEEAVAAVPREAAAEVADTDLP